MDLRDIKGIGERQADKILSNFNNEEEFIEAVQNFEVDRISNIEGVSQKKAINIINALLGNPTEEFLKTDHAVQIYNDIIERILKFSSTNYSRNRVLLMNPLKNEVSIMEHVDFVMNAKDFVSKLPVDEIRMLLKKITKFGK